MVSWFISIIIWILGLIKCSILIWEKYMSCKLCIIFHFVYFIDLFSFIAVKFHQNRIPSINWHFSDNSPPPSSAFTAKCFDFWVKVEGSACQNVNYKVPLHFLENNLSFVWWYRSNTLVGYGGWYICDMQHSKINLNCDWTMVHKGLI